MWSIHSHLARRPPPKKSAALPKDYGSDDERWDAEEAGSTSWRSSSTVSADRASVPDNESHGQEGLSSSKRSVLRPEDEEAFLKELLEEDDNVGDENGRDEKTETVTFIDHVVLPDDTFHGICLQYKITPVELRRANCFSGTNLNLAPKTLKIPVTSPPPNSSNRVEETNSPDGLARKRQDTSTEEYKVQALRNQFPALEESQARGFLESYNWDLDAAVQFLLQLCA